MLIGLLFRMCAMTTSEVPDLEIVSLLVQTHYYVTGNLPEEGERWIARSICPDVRRFISRGGRVRWKLVRVGPSDPGASEGDHVIKWEYYANGEWHFGDDLEFFKIDHKQIWETRYVVLVPKWEPELLDTITNASHELAEQVSLYFANKEVAPKSLADLAAYAGSALKSWEKLRSAKGMTFTIKIVNDRSLIYITKSGRRVGTYPLVWDGRGRYPVPWKMR